MFIQKHFTLHVTAFFFLNIRNFEVWTLDPQYLKKKLFLLTNTSLKGEKRTRKSSFKNARKQSKMGKQGKKKKVTQVY